MPKAILIDPRVHELATFWLSDDDTASAKNPTEHHARVMSLASDIQQAIESWCDDEAHTAEEQDAKDAEMRALRGLTDAERERI